MGYKFLFIFALFSFLCSSTQCARILVVVPTPSYSHNIMYRTIYKELSLRGHEIVAFTPNPLRDPDLTNLTEIDLNFFYKFASELPYEKFFTYYRISIVALIQDGLLKLTREIFAHPEMKKIINNTNERFDLIMVEWSVNPSFSVLSKRFNCPLIGMRPLGLRPEGHDSVGNPTTPSYLPIGYMNYEDDFWGRVDNFLLGVMWRIHHHLFVVREAQRIANEFFPGYSKNDILEIEKNVSIVLTNTHPIITGVRPLVPGMIEVGGVHLRREPREIPKDVKEYLDNAKEGVVYFNLGGNVKSSSLDPAILKIIISALSELPYKVIWKWEKNAMVNPPSNIKIWNWLPQQAILRHPNIKAFIMHGGLQSLYEAVDNQVPLVGIPFFADHFINARQIEKLKIGKRLNIKDLTKRTLINAVKSVIKNPRYKKNLKKAASILHDMPMKPLDKAVWWIEYVLRHKNDKHLRSSAVDLDWVTYLSLDVLAFIIVCLITLILSNYYIILYLRNLIKCFKKQVYKEKCN